MNRTPGLLFTFLPFWQRKSRKIVIVILRDLVFILLTAFPERLSGSGKENRTVRAQLSGHQ